MKYILLFLPISPFFSFYLFITFSLTVQVNCYIIIIQYVKTRCFHAVLNPESAFSDLSLPASPRSCLPANHCFHSFLLTIAPAFALLLCPPSRFCAFADITYTEALPNLQPEEPRIFRQIRTGTAAAYLAHTVDIAVWNVMLCQITYAGFLHPISKSIFLPV